MRKIYLLLVLLGQLWYNLWSGQYVPVERFTINDGLSHSVITSLFNDSKGFLWVGTTDGLNRYDGYEFKKYQSVPGDNFSIPNDFINKIIGDHNGQIYCATASGVCSYNFRLNNFSSLEDRPNPVDNATISDVVDLALSPSENELFVLRQNSLVQIDLESKKPTFLIHPLIDSEITPFDFRSFKLFSDSSEIIINNGNSLLRFQLKNKLLEAFPAFPEKITARNESINNFLFTTRGNILLCTSKKLWEYDRIDCSWSEIKMPVKFLKSDFQIFSLFLAANNELKIATNIGVLRYFLSKKQFDTEETIDLRIATQETSTSFLEDRSGVYWIGTNEGLFKINPLRYFLQNVAVSELFGKDNQENIAAASFDNLGHIWAGTSTGKICILNNLEGNSKPVIAGSFSLNARIIGITYDYSGNIYVSTNKGLYKYKPFQFKNEQNIPLRYLVDFEVFASICDSSNTVFTASSKGIFSIAGIDGLPRPIENLDSIIGKESVLGLKCTSTFLWVIQSHRIVELNRMTRKTKIITFRNAGFTSLPNINTTVAYSANSLLIGTADGLFIYSAETGKLLPFNTNSILENIFIHAVNTDLNRNVWISTHKGIYRIEQATGENRQYDVNDGLLFHVFSDRLSSRSSHGELLFGGKQGFTIFHPDSMILHLPIPNVEFTEIILSGKQESIIQNIISMDTLQVDPRFKYIKIGFSTLDFWAQTKSIYKYSIEETGHVELWNNLNGQNHLIVSGLNAGYYKLSIKGANSEGVWSESPREIIIHIIAPFWFSRLAFFFYTILAIVVFYFTIFFYTRHLRKLNRDYKEKELIAKKIEQQKEELALKNKNITDSINYAKRIQMALMPPPKIFKKHFPDSFLLHMPKDIVSGDFYWINEVSDRIYFAAVDCTGHGVPGAFMSIIGFELLRRITETEKKNQPSEILNSLSQGFETVFKDVEGYNVRDGMDVAFCAIDRKMKFLEFSGAFNPLYIIRENSIIEIKGDRFAVGLNTDDDGETNIFKNHFIPLFEGDIIYIFTDGFADQFGGPEGKKYKYRRFRHLLLALHQLPMERQSDFLRRSIFDWKGNLDQVDDILVIGIRVTQT